MTQPDKSDHHIALCSSFLIDDKWAECSCGWYGPKRALAGEAAADGEYHLRGYDAPSREQDA